MNEIVNHVIALTYGFPNQSKIKTYLQDIIYEAVSSPAYSASLLYDRKVEYKRDLQAKQS